MKRDSVNKRRFLRVKFPYTVHIHIKEGKDISTYTDNISRGGVGLTLKERLNPKDILTLRIYIADVPVECKGEVVWVKERNSPMLDGVRFFDTGIEFKDMDDNSTARIGSCIKELKQQTNTE